jgi:hypothetical protein
MSDTISTLNQTYSMTSNLNFWLTLLGAFFSFFGIIITFYTLSKVRTISKAKHEERAVLARSLRIRELLDNLRITEGYLANKQAVDLENVHLSLARLNTELETSLRILIPEIPTEEVLSNVQVIPNDYWTDMFASSVIAKTKKNLIIVVWRCTRIFREEMLQKFIDSLVENPKLEIKLFYVSPLAPDYVFDTLEVMLTLGNASEIKEQQQLTKKFAISTIKHYTTAKKIEKLVLNRLYFFEYKVIPNLHCVIADEEVDWGINFFMEPNIGATKVLSNAYLKSTISTSFGVKILEQIKILESLSEHIVLFD